MANAIIQSTGLTISDAVRLLMTRIAADGAMPLDLFQRNAETTQAIHVAQAGILENTTIDKIVQAIDDDRA